MVSEQLQSLHDVCLLLEARLLSVASFVQPWKDEFSAGKYHDVATKIEAHLVVDPEDYEAKLWWIQAERFMNLVPVSALCTTFEELAPCISEEAKYCELASLVSLGLASTLLERGQTRLSVVMLLRAFEFAVSSVAGRAEDQVALKDACLKILQIEVERAKVRKEKPAYIANLEQETVRISSFVPKVESKPEVVPVQEPGVSPKSKLAAQVSELSSKSILETAYSLGGPKDLEPDSDGISKSDALEVEIIKGSNRSRRLNQTAQNGGGRVPSREVRVFVYVAALLVVVGGGYILWGIRESRYFAARADAGFPGSDGQEFLVSALVPRRIQLGAGQKMNELSSRLDRLREVRESGTAEVTPDPLQSPEVDHEALRMSQDVEIESESSQSQELKQIDTERKSSQDLQAPSIGDTKVTDLGGMGPKVVVDSLRVDRQGRRYGTPSQGQEKSGIDPLTGEPVRSYPVEEFSAPQTFITIKPTEVLSAPSMVSVRVEPLPSGAKLQAVGRVGHWLEILSVGGQRGYVLAQDAEPFGN